jgi:hypothetical protein
MICWMEDSVSEGENSMQLVQNKVWLEGFDIAHVVKIAPAILLGHFRTRLREHGMLPFFAIEKSSVCVGWASRAAYTSAERCILLTFELTPSQHEWTARSMS